MLELFFLILQYLNLKVIFKRKKAANFKASKKYQNKHAEEYKLSHLNSVKKHKQEHADEYKLSNLNAICGKLTLVKDLKKYLNSI
jgi:hypothetical protein